jgi:ATP-dependent Lon protease
MTRDNQSKMNKKETKLSRRKEEESRNRNRKQNEDSSNDSDISLYTDDDDDNNSEDELDVLEYRKFLKNLFPSKHLDKKIKAGEQLKQTLSDEEDNSDYIDEEDSDYIDETEEEEDIKPKRKIITRSQKNNTKRQKKSNDLNDSFEEEEEEEHCKSKSKSKKNASKKRIVYSEEEDEEDYEEDYEDEEEDYEEEEDKGVPNKKNNKFNIIFTIGGNGNINDNDNYESDEFENSSDSNSNSNTENEDDPISSDSELEKISDNECVTKSNSKKNKHAKGSEKSPKKHIMDKIKDAFGIETLSKEKTTSDEDIILILKDLQSKNKNNELVNECLRVCEAKIKNDKEKQEKRSKKEKARNSRIFKRILRDKNTTNDFEFYDKLETSQQNKIIKELREINKITRVEKPYRLTLLESDIPVILKATAMKKISSLRYMEPGSGEFYKIKNWVDTFMRIPFGEYKTLPISITDGVEKCHDFMENAQKTLDEAVYGLNDAKMQIMQLLGQLITNPKAIGSAVAIHGPPGTGKTSLVKEGISKILNRPFAFIALGGATDSSFLEGHGYTYEGSTWGKIVQILIDSKCMNPVIYFDELDKISDTPKGEEIAGILTHLTDTSQNTQFHDKYFAEIDFDLSKCLFIFSYNDESKVNPILKDRMYRIQTKGYNQKQKTAISNNYLLPRIREQVKFSVEDIIIPEQTLHYIIENHCNKEDGVRNLKRCLEIIYTKLNLYRLMRPGSNLFEEDMSLKVEFPFMVTKDIVDKLIKKSDSINQSLYHLYI